MPGAGRPVAVAANVAEAPHALAALLRTWLAGAVTTGRVLTTTAAVPANETPVHCTSETAVSAYVWSVAGLTGMSSGEALAATVTGLVPSV